MRFSAPPARSGGRRWRSSTRIRSSRRARSRRGRTSSTRSPPSAGIAHAQVGGDLDRAARPSRAGRRPERGRRLRRAARDALGARAGRDARAREQGEPRRGGRASRSPPASGVEACSCRSTASTRRSSSASRAARSRRSTRSCSRPRAGRSAAARASELEGVTRADALAHPTWQMGPKITVDSATLANKGLELIEAHFLFGLPYERIEVVVHPTSVVHAIVRFRDGASLAHLGYPDMRVPISYALTYPERAATPVEGLDFSEGLSLEFEPPDLETFPLLALARRCGRVGRHVSVRLQRGERGRRGGVPRGAAAVPRNRRRRRRRRSTRWTERRPATSTSSSRPTPSPPPGRERCRSARPVNVFVAILGLGLLVLVHEAGHFFTARAVGMSPRRFYIGFPPAIVKVERQRNRVRHRRDPARRLREDPRDAPAGPVRPGHVLRAGARRGARAARPDRAREAQARRGRHGRRARELAGARAGARTASSSAAWRASGAAKGLAELRDGLGGDAYWRQRTWKKVSVIFAGPGTNLLFAIVLFAALFVIGSGGYRLGFSMETDTPVVHDVRVGSSRGEDRAPAGRPDRRDQRPAGPDRRATCPRSSRSRTAAR